MNDPIDLGNMPHKQYGGYYPDSHYSSSHSALPITDNDSTRGLRAGPVSEKSHIQQRVVRISSNANRHRWWSIWHPQSWFLELLCIFISLACLLSLGIIFYRFQGRPLSDWKFRFSLNTVASILGTIAKSSLLLAVGSAIGQGKWQWFNNSPRPLIDFGTFDDATRGPLGGLTLIWTLRFRHFDALGALIVVLSPASDPFLQAVITYAGKLDDAPALSGLNQATDLQALVNRSERWASFDSFVYTQDTKNTLADGNSYVAYPYREDFSTSAAFYGGVVSSSLASVAAVNFGCWTGNCTSDAFTSVAVCSQCTDITKLVQHHTVEDATPEEIARSASQLGEEFETLTNYTLPNIWTDNFGGGNASYTSLLEAALTLDPLKTNAFTKMENMLAAITMMKYNGIATECALYLCVNAYQSTVSNGTLDEKIVGTWAQRVPSSYSPEKTQPQQVQINNTASVHSDTWTPPYSAGYLNRSDYQLSIPQDSSGKPVFGNATVFGVSQSAIVTFQDFLQKMFISTAFDSNLTKYPTHELAYGHASSPLFTSPVLQPLLNSANITDTFDRIATSMTNTIRNSANTPAQQTTAQQWTLHVRIMWGFMIFPLATTVLGCLYALFTIIGTTSNSIPVFKTNVLASLTHEIHGNLVDTLKEMPLDGQQDLAKKSLVCLKERDGVVELRGQGEHVS